MEKKLFIQLLIFFFIIAISIFFFLNYFLNNNKNEITKKNTFNNIEENLENLESNIIYDIEYSSKDNDGNIYFITSKFGELNDEKPELILMKDVVAIINIKNSTPIKISAKNALYNNVNYETNFYEDVLVSYENHAINSNNLDLIFQKNLATITNNIVYKNLNTKLQADKIEIDLITKNSKIFMNNKFDKINIVSID